MCGEYVAARIDAPEKRLELRIGTELVKARIVVKVNDPVGARLERSIKRCLGFLFVADSNPGRGQVVVG